MFRSGPQVTLAGRDLGAGPWPTQFDPLRNPRGPSLSRLNLKLARFSGIGPKETGYSEFWN